VLLLDTHALVFDALSPARLGRRARQAINAASASGDLGCSDISLWEIAMLVARRRLDPGTSAEEFMRVALAARRIHVMPITVEIAVLSQSDAIPHKDPADRIIAATALYHRANLATGDAQLQRVEGIKTVW